MTETVHSDYEVSSEGAIRHWEIPYADFEDVTPTPTNAASVTGRVPGIDLNGTHLTIDAINAIAITDFTSGIVYMHDVRTVLTYAANVENTWGALNIGDPVYYDPSATMVVLGIYLSISPLRNNGAANTRFGWIVPAPLAGAFDTDTARFPLAAGAAGNTHRVAVLSRGAGGG
jgi:hypothetical protein